LVTEYFEEGQNLPPEARRKREKLVSDRRERGLNKVGVQSPTMAIPAASAV
jgi:hypothetical protein